MTDGNGAMHPQDCACWECITAHVEERSRLNIKPIPVDDFPGKPTGKGYFLPWRTAMDGAEKDLPDRDWIIKDILPAGEVTLFNGDGGSGKTITALQLGVAVRLEADWMGHLVERGAGGDVWFLTSEETEIEVRRRLRSIVYARAADESILKGFDFICFRDHGLDPALAIEKSRSSVKTTPVFDELLKRAIRRRPRLIILENVTSIFDGDEIRRALVTRFLGVATELATKSGAAVLLLQHVSMSGKSSGEQTSGSTHWHNGVRSRMSMAVDSSDPSNKTRILTFHKANYGKKAEKITLEWRNGIYLPLVDDAPSKLAAYHSIEEAFMTCMKIKTDQGYVLRPSNTGYGAARMFTEMPEANGYEASQLRAAQERLLRSNRIAIVIEGSASRRRQRLVLNSLSGPPCTTTAPYIRGSSSSTGD